MTASINYFAIFNIYLDAFISVSIFNYQSIVCINFNQLNWTKINETSNSINLDFK